jgi:hypothetical protein
MTPRWDSSFDHPTRRDTAMLSEVLDTLRAQLTEPDEGTSASPDIEELISAAVSELHRLSPGGLRSVGGIAPVLGSGVLQELLRRRRENLSGASEDVAPVFDQRR